MVSQSLHHDVAGLSSVTRRQSNPGNCQQPCCFDCWVALSYPHYLHWLGSPAYPSGWYPAQGCCRLLGGAGPLCRRHPRVPRWSWRPDRCPPRSFLTCARLTHRLGVYCCPPFLVISYLVCANEQFDINITDIILLWSPTMVAIKK